MKTSVLAVVFALALVCLSFQSTFAQKSDTTFQFRGAASVTNDGFSFVPAFTLGKPAGMLDFVIGNKRLTFEPQFRYALEGRPWSFVFIYRYKFIRREKFHFAVGGHVPGINFVTRTVNINGIDEKMSVARRYLTLELFPTYFINKSLNVGLFYLRGHGFQHDGPRNSNFLALRSNISNIRLGGSVYAVFSPQVFYLKLDNTDGFYVNSTATLGIRNFPLSVSGIVNKAIQSTIVAKKFDWNISLVYTLDRSFVRR